MAAARVAAAVGAAGAELEVWALAREPEAAAPEAAEPEADAAAKVAG